MSRAFPAIAAQWHSSKNGSLRPRDVSVGSARRVWWQCRKDSSHEWDAVINRRVVVSPRCPFCAGRRVARDGRGSLALEAPEIARQWHPTKNGRLTAKEVLPGSNSEVWWRCPVDPEHEWQTKVYRRARMEAGCPFCSSRRVSVTNSLATLAPRLAREWHPTRNGKLTPFDVVRGSHRPVWWRCARDATHEWRNSVKARKGGCPFCRNRRPTLATSLARRAPKLAAQWHPTKNGGLGPEDVVPGSNRRVWWKCRRGPDHEWQVVIAMRKGCPFCSNHRLSVTNSLAARFPALAREWHPKKNGALRPSAVLPRAKRVVWWKCAKGPDHEWSTPVFNRPLAGSGCPFCAGRRLSVTNCFAARHPRMAHQWHPTLNRGITAHDVFSNSTTRVWWLCERGHAWLVSVRSRVASQSGCPACSARGRKRRPATTRRVREVIRLPSDWS